MLRLDAVRDLRLQYDSALTRAEDMAFWADALLGAGLNAANLQEPLLRYRYAPAPHARHWHIRALTGHVFPALGLKATAAQAALHAELIYGGAVAPEAALRWLDGLWRHWTARFGEDASMVITQTAGHLEARYTQERFGFASFKPVNVANTPGEVVAAARFMSADCRILLPFVLPDTTSMNL